MKDTSCLLRCRCERLVIEVFALRHQTGEITYLLKRISYKDCFQGKSWWPWLGWIHYSCYGRLHIDTLRRASARRLWNIRGQKPRRLVCELKGVARRVQLALLVIWHCESSRYYVICLRTNISSVGEVLWRRCECGGMVVEELECYNSSLL